MVKPLSLQDFRAVRKILEPKDFGLSSKKPDPKPTDLINKESWDHLTNLTDHIAIQTSNYFGSDIKNLLDFKLLCLRLINIKHYKDLHLETCILSIHEDLEAACFNLLHGFYRQVFQVLRSALDHLIVSIYIETMDHTSLKSKLTFEEKEINFGNSCDSLRNYPPIKQLEQFLEITANDNLFQSMDREKKFEGGLIRRLFRRLSKYIHPEHGYTDGDLWESNGPIFNHVSFSCAVECYHEIVLVCILLMKVVKEDFLMDNQDMETFYLLKKMEILKKSNTLKEAMEYVFIF